MACRGRASGGGVYHTIPTGDIFWQLGRSDGHVNLFPDATTSPAAGGVSISAARDSLQSGFSLKEPYSLDLSSKPDTLDLGYDT